MTDRSCLNCKHTYHSEICRECCVGDKFEPRPNAPQPNKQLAELLNLRKLVQAQREEIKRLQRPTGTWIETSDFSDEPIEWVDCSVCKEHVPGFGFWFCPWCGADMRDKKERSTE